MNQLYNELTEGLYKALAEPPHTYTVRKNSMSAPADLLREAALLVSETKNEEHGSYEDTFGMTAALWSMYLDVTVSPRDVAAMMILLKVGRDKTAPGNRDNALDAAGYAGLMGAL